MSDVWTPDVYKFSNASNGLVFRRGIEKFRQDIIKTFKYVDFSDDKWEKMLIFVGACDLFDDYKELDTVICRGDMTVLNYTNGIWHDSKKDTVPVIDLRYMDLATSYDVSYTIIEGRIVSIGRIRR